MSCPPERLKDYFFGELPVTDRSAVEHHVATCAGCREELAALGNTRAALMALPDEEPPRRIAFVSDKVFEPRWWQRIWTSGAQLGFASAAMLAAAILVHAWVVRPEAVTKGVPAVQQTAGTQAEIDSRVRAQVAEALADNEAKQLGRVLELVDAKLRENDQRDRQTLVLIQEYLERIDK